MGEATLLSAGCMHANCFRFGGRTFIMAKQGNLQDAHCGTDGSGGGGAGSARAKPNWSWHASVGGGGGAQSRT